jgi:hypothetical protein
MELRRRVTMAGVVLLALAATIGPASAKPLERVHFHDSGSEVIEGFCGDLTVRFDFEVDGTFLLNPHGPDGLAYGLENFRGTESLTNLANDKTITRVFDVTPIPPTSRFVSGDLVRVGRRDGLGMGCGRR